MGFKVRIDIGKNRLYFTISGKAVKGDLDKLYTDVRFCVADLRPGFDVITDLSECTLGHLSGVTTFRKIMNYLITKEVGSVVRIIDGKSLIFKQVLNLSSRICGYKPIYVPNLKEAEAILENSIKRNGIRFNISKLPVEYIFEKMNGAGNIYNISTSGCAVESATLPVKTDTKISIKFEFREHAVKAEFVLESRVVRVDVNNFAVQFENLDNDQRGLLWKCLLEEAHREL